MSRWTVRSFLALFSLNLALWLLAWSVSLPLSDDLVMFDPATARLPLDASGSGATFDRRTCAHCPPYILVGKELGSPGDVTYLVLAFSNDPAIRFAKGTHLGLGIHALKPWHLLGGVAVQWALVGFLWYTWIHRRRSLPKSSEARRAP
jgi:hypothetical protein